MAKHENRERLKEEIKSTVPIEDVAAALGLGDWAPHSKGFNGPCFNVAAHKDNRGRKLNLIKDPRGGDWFHCWACGIGGDVIRFVELVKGVQFNEAVRWLIERYRPADLGAWDHAAQDHPSGDEAKSGEYYTAAALHEKIFELGRRLLYEDAGKEALDYLLHGRIYDLETLKKTEWIYFPPVAEIKAHLLKECAGQGAADAIEALALNPRGGDVLRVALPWRDRFGRISGFVLRSTDPKGGKGWAGGIKKDRDDPQDPKKNDLFNLHSCKRNDALLIVEGTPDAAYLSRLDLGAGVAIAATGGGGLHDKHLDGLRARGIDKVIISFDNDKDRHGLNFTAASVDLLTRRGGLDVFVIHPADLGAHKDPEDLVTHGAGLGALAALIANAERWDKWRLRTLKDRLDASAKTDQDTSAYWKEVRALLAAVAKAQKPEMLASLRDAVKGNEPGVDIDEIIRDVEKDEKARGIEDAIKNALADFEHDKSLDDLRRNLDAISHKETAPIIRTAPRTFNDYLRMMQDEPPAMMTGFSKLDRFAPIPSSALTVIAGRPSHGKTTFMLNLMMNQVRLYPDKMFFYFSYEQTETQLITLLLMRTAGVILDQDNNFSKYRAYLTRDKKPVAEIDKAKKTLQDLTASGRFWLMDTRHNIDQLIAVIHGLAELHPIGAVFIDYVQKIGAAAKSYTRQTELQGISNKIQCAANALQIPVIMGAQFNREGAKDAQATQSKRPDKKKAISADYIREAGDIEQDATLILSLWDDIMSGGNDPNLTVTIMKNRYGSTGKQISLKYERPVNTMTDLEEDRKAEEAIQTGLAGLYEDDED